MNEKNVYDIIIFCAKSKWCTRDSFAHATHLATSEHEAIKEIEAQLGEHETIFKIILREEGKSFERKSEYYDIESAKAAKKEAMANE